MRSRVATNYPCHTVCYLLFRVDLLINPRIIYFYPNAQNIWITYTHLQNITDYLKTHESDKLRGNALAETVSILEVFYFFIVHPRRNQSTLERRVP